ncbi:MAG: 3-dehydroquinate synthase, partial [Clostridia bacterium]|nr:3-dehydroquinate synthase [Clostridia bacterium]
RITPSDIDNIDYEDLIVKALEIKKDIVERDEKESGDRMLLNFGHTIGHAIEKLYDYKVSHGECVLKGMAYSLKYSNEFGYLSDLDYKLALEFLSKAEVSLTTNFKIEDILKIVKSDKKADGDMVNFVFAKGFGLSVIEKIEISKLAK